MTARVMSLSSCVLKEFCGVHDQLSALEPELASLARCFGRAPADMRGFYAEQIIELTARYDALAAEFRGLVHESRLLALEEGAP